MIWIFLSYSHSNYNIQIFEGPEIASIDWNCEKENKLRCYINWNIFAIFWIKPGIPIEFATLNWRGSYAKSAITQFIFKKALIENHKLKWNFDCKIVMFFRNGYLDDNIGCTLYTYFAQLIVNALIEKFPRNVSTEMIRSISHILYQCEFTMSLIFTIVMQFIELWNWCYRWIHSNLNFTKIY